MKVKKVLFVYIFRKMAKNYGIINLSLKMCHEPDKKIIYFPFFPKLLSLMIVLSEFRESEFLISRTSNC